MLSTRFTPVLIEGRPFDDLWLQCIIRLWYEFPGKGFDDSRWVDAVR